MDDSTRVGYGFAHAIAEDDSRLAIRRPHQATDDRQPFSADAERFS
jgi:hypothetical protein